MSDKRFIEAFRSAVENLSPARKQAIDDMLTGKISVDDAPMQNLHFGGECRFDEDLRLVELNGDFSQEDLLRIASMMTK